jgi:hypothetical protein
MCLREIRHRVFMAPRDTVLARYSPACIWVRVLFGQREVCSREDILEPRDRICSLSMQQPEI